jgi:glycosyltransferase involved in cell wall biosynthesis
MKILYLLTQDIESPSGLGRYFPLAKELTRGGHQVTIAALHPRYRTLTEKCFIKEGVKIRYIGQMHVQKIGNEKIYYSPARLLVITMQATFAFLKVALSEPADLIQICKPHPMNSLAGLGAKVFKKRKLFLDCDDFEAGSGRFEGSWQRRIIAFFEKNTPRYVNAITTNTLFMRQKLLDWGIPEARISYLPNGVDRSRFENPDLSKIQQLRNQLGLQGKKVIAYIGSLSLASHSVDLLVEAFVIIHHEMPDTRLLLVGGGEDYEFLQKLVDEKGITKSVLFVGRVSPDQVVNYYHLADVSVDPVIDNDAARGRSPLKLFESWACGVPFVTADVGDRKMLAGEPSAAIMVNSCNELALSESILTFFLNPDMSKFLQIQGYKSVSRYFWDVLVEKIFYIYQS